MVAVIILNWNGYEDTIECLKSLKNAMGDFFIIVVDNGSDNDSIFRLLDYLNSEIFGHHTIREGEELNHIPNNRECILYCLNENYGFAKGNNMAIQLLHEHMPEWCLLLNNDTTVTNDFLTKLTTFTLQHKDYKIVTPLIYYYYDKKIIWNAGGNILWGFRKYNYPDQTKEAIKEKYYIDCTFITGCALMFKSDLLSKDKKIFTELFFHGEEDFDLSIRMNKARVKMACVLDSIIYHKVNKSTAHIKSLGKIYVHYLNRFINIKRHFCFLNYKLWELISLCTVIRTLKRHGLRNHECLKFCIKLTKDSKKLESIDKAKFFELMQHYE